MKNGGYRAQAVRAFTLIELLIVIALIATVIACVLPVLSRVRRSAASAQLDPAARGDELIQAVGPPRTRLLARVQDFDAAITLTPKLSVGTADPESIYEARFSATVAAVAPLLLAKTDGRDTDAIYELELPLPPQIISLSDLSVMVGGRPSEDVELRDNKLVWHGILTREPSSLAIVYTAVGKGLYAMEIPAGQILDRFHIALTASGSDVRMLERSLQPTSLGRAGGAMIYDWNYRQLMSGQPIRLDVLGIAPIDRLGELAWLGPFSVVVFGMVVGFVAHAYRIPNFDRWLLVLVLGLFAGAYPLMYFAQEFVQLRTAIGCSGGFVLLVIAIRTSTIMGMRLALFGVVLPAVAIMSITLAATMQPHLQGILVTIELLGLFILAMTLMPRIQGNSSQPPYHPAAALA